MVKGVGRAKGVAVIERNAGTKSRAKKSFARLLYCNVIKKKFSCTSRKEHITIGAKLLGKREVVRC